MAEESITKSYSKGGLTVFWRPDTCIHSKNCWKGLIDVFDPRKRPWINLDGASDEEIIKQIKACPSGALSYSMDGDIVEEDAEAPLTRIEIAENGPILYHGSCIVQHTDGSTEVKEKVTAFCRCGASENKPYCDGAHKQIDFKG